MALCLMEVTPPVILVHKRNIRLQLKPAAPLSFNQRAKEDELQLASICPAQVSLRKTIPTDSQGATCPQLVLGVTAAYEPLFCERFSDSPSRLYNLRCDNSVFSHIFSL